MHSANDSLLACSDGSAAGAQGNAHFLVRLAPEVKSPLNEMQATVPPLVLPTQQRVGAVQAHFLDWDVEDDLLHVWLLDQLVAEAEDVHLDQLILL